MPKDPFLFESGQRERELDALFRANYAGLFRFASRLLGSEAEAEEVVQEVFLYIWRQDQALDDSLRPYLYRAVRNNAFSRLRRRRIENRWLEQAALLPKTHGETASSRLDHNELEAAVERAVAELPERTRLVYTLSREHNLTYANIAHALGISPKTVEAQMSRAFKLLRKSLADFLPALLLLIR